MRFTVFLFIISICSLPAKSQRVQLSDNWTYSFHSSLAGEAASRLSEKEMPWVEKDTMLRNTGVVTFKRTVIIPSSLKPQFDTTGLPALYLGKVLQADETFFNGTLIGKTGSSDIFRVYTIPTKLIRWDGENTIEIRVEHWGQKGGATMVPYLAEAKPANIFSVSTTYDETVRKLPALNKNIAHDFVITSALEKTVAATVVAHFYNSLGSLLHSDERSVTINNGTNHFPFNYTSPSSFLKVVYTLHVPSYSLRRSWNEVAGYERVVYKEASYKVPFKVPLLFEPALLENQKMTGWLGDRFTINMEKRLKQVDEFAILEGYINKPGKHPWIGEHVGKFIEAACNTFRSTGDQALKVQIDRTVQQLLASQMEDGYLGTYTAANEWTSWDVWSHKYNLVGLLSYYQLSGYEPALTGAKRIGDLLSRKFGTGQGQRNIIRSGAHVGMAATSVIDPMTDLYAFTGDKKYLDFCYYIVSSYNGPNGPAIIKTLNATGRVDKTANAKAYEMLSNLVGLAKLYKITADTAVLEPVIKAWKDIVEKRLYITGTTSSFEHFQEDYILPAAAKDNMGEGCVTTTWLQLNYQLLTIFGTTQYVDELERAVYNHLAGAENPQTGCVSYYTPLQGQKPYGCNITCCMSSVPRGIAMIPLFVNGKIKNSTSFLFYQPGEYKTSVKDRTNKTVTIRFKTVKDFLDQGSVDIIVDPTMEAPFKVLLRKPYWSNNLSVSINGAPYPLAPGDFIPVERNWRKGDKISIHFEMPVITLNGNKSYPGMIALQRGPQVLVYDRSLNKIDAGSIQLQTNNIRLEDAGSLLPHDWIGKQGYSIGSSTAQKEKVLFVPYADAGQTGGTISTWLPKANLTAE